MHVLGSGENPAGDPYLSQVRDNTGLAGDAATRWAAGGGLRSSPYSALKASIGWIAAARTAG
jgi:hypothetical protein